MNATINPTSRLRSMSWLMLGVLVLGPLAATGCRSVAGVLGDDDAEARSGSVWNVPAPFLEPPPAENRTVYVSWRNMSDASEINLTQDLKASLQNAGYTVVNDPQGAHFRLRARLRYFGENEQADGGVSKAAALGGISGAAIGYGVGRSASNSYAGGSIGAGAGAVGGSLAGIAIANRMKAKEWNLIVDILLEEYHEGGVEFTVGSDTDRTSGTSSLAVSSTPGGSTSQAVGGRQTDTTTKNTTITQKSNYFPHGMRLTAWARQIQMTREEALPLMQDKIANALPNVMP